MREEPAKEQGGTVFADSIQNSLIPAELPCLFYLPSAHETDAGRQLSRAVHKETENRGLRLVLADPDEAVRYTLPWYAQQIYSSVAVLVHFCADWRKGAATYNPRVSLIAGLALGMGRPVFMLAEEDYADPLDYRDFLYVYSTPKACVDKGRGWLDTTLGTGSEPVHPERKLRLATELKSIRLGEPVAENEEEDLSTYFVETGSFLQVLEDRVTVFLGRKGTGKTANFFEAAKRLARDRRNVVCVIKPFSYEIDGLQRILAEYSERELQSYLTEALWKYLLYSEIAITVGNEIRNRPSAAVVGTPAEELLQYLDDPANDVLREDFAVRLERTVSTLGRASASVPDAKRSLSEALHQSTLQELRRLVKQAVAGKQRVAIVIDNLDKAWDASADLTALAHLLLGLLVATGSVRRDFGRSEFDLEPLSVSLAVFLRTDIFAHVSAAAREPDKIPTTTIEWKNWDLLFRIVEERFIAGREDAKVDDLWNRFIVRNVDAQPTRTYIAERLLARPRDLVYFLNEAIVQAVNSGHSTVNDVDLNRALAAYSQFAFEALLVEHGLATTDLEAVLIEIAGAPAIMERQDVLSRIAAAGVPESDAGEVLGRLRMLSVLGTEVTAGEFSFEENLQSVRIDGSRSRELETELGRPSRLCVHPAYRSYLSISEAP